MLRFVRALPLFAVAVTALVSALQVACARDDDAMTSEGALGDYADYDGYAVHDITATCVPQSVSVPWIPPQRLHQNVCSSVQVAAVALHLAAGTYDTLKDDPSFAACLQCAVSPAGAFSYGAIVDYGSGLRLANVGGCIAQLTGALGSRGCGASVQKAYLCPSYACGITCADDFESCAQASVTPGGPCADVSERATCRAEVVKPGASAEACATTNEEGASLEDWKKYLTLFCGP